MRYYGKERRIRKFWIIIGSIASICACGIGFFVGSYFPLNREAEVVKKQDLLNKQQQLAEIDKQLGEKEELFQKFKAYQEQQETLNKDLLEKLNQKQELESQITAIREELHKLTGQRDEILSQPIVISTGFHQVGEDLPAGTYDIHLLSGNGNLFITGSVSINELFGTYSQYGYIQEFKNALLQKGDQIEIRNDLKLQFIKKKP